MHGLKRTTAMESVVDLIPNWGNAFFFFYFLAHKRIDRGVKLKKKKIPHHVLSMIFLSCLNIDTFITVAIALRRPRGRGP